MEAGTDKRAITFILHQEKLFQSLTHIDISSVAHTKFSLRRLCLTDTFVFFADRGLLEIVK